MKTCLVPSRMSGKCSEEAKQAQKAETSKCFEMFYFQATIINCANSCKLFINGKYLQENQAMCKRSI
jgi:hypothetical protein